MRQAVNDITQIYKKANKKTHRYDGTDGFLFIVTDIIETVIISVPAQEFFYFIVSAGNLFNQISTHAVPVQMIVTTLFAHEAEVFRIENDIIEYAFFDISITFVT